MCAKEERIINTVKKRVDNCATLEEAVEVLRIIQTAHDYAAAKVESFKI